MASLTLPGNTKNLPSGIVGAGKLSASSLYTSSDSVLVSSRNKLAATLSGVAGTKIAHVGDSRTSGFVQNGSGGPPGLANRGVGDIPSRHRNMFKSSGWPVGEGAVGLCESFIACPDSRVTVSAGWTVNAFGGVHFYSTATNGAAITVVSTQTGTTVDVEYYDAPATSTFSITVDGVVVANVVPTNTGTVKVRSTPGMTNTTHTVVVTCTNNAAGLVPFWVDVYSPSTLSVANFGVSGATAYYAGVVPSWGVAGLGYGLLQVATAYAADLYVVELGINDFIQGYTTAQLIAALEMICTTLNAAGADILLVNPVTSVVYPTSWQQAYYTVADTLGIALYDEVDHYGGAARAAALNTFGADGIHCLIPGYAGEARGIFAAIAA
jgi:lysophospholipase L1-like esterase